VRISERTLEGKARVAVFSDVHANLPALEAVLADVRRSGVDRIWCLGDLVGYGGQPNECVALVSESAEICLVGNHDLVALGQLYEATFSPAAAAAARWTKEQLDAGARGYLEGLKPVDESQLVGLYHGSPRDPVWEYVLSPLLADACMDVMQPRIGAVGHSHVALSFNREEGGSTGGAQAEAGHEADLTGGDWILNPGAVGQPRDGDPRAAWLLLDLEAWTASWRRVEYDIEHAADAIREAGLPPALADRLYYGQ
jgi:diadenosine tetraphosphatase ApaH/serine/threonine PP2A family protein phosphatase